MIFVAVGTQLSFDRLTRTVDDWAAKDGRTDVYGQIGPTKLVPRAIHAVSYLSPEAFADHCERASVLVGHAGMGLIISALELGKPLIIMPRRASLSEHRNEHQLATARRFSNTEGVYTAFDEGALTALLQRNDQLTAGANLSRSAKPELLQALQRFIDLGGE